MKNKFVKSIFLFLLSLFLISSCKKNKAVLDVSVFQSITPTEQWAVVVDSYVSFYADSSKKASVQANGRRGDVLEMQGEKWVRVLNGKEKWYFFEKVGLNNRVLQSTAMPCKHRRPLKFY